MVPKIYYKRAKIARASMGRVFAIIREYYAHKALAGSSLHSLSVPKIFGPLHIRNGYIGYHMEYVSGQHPDNHNGHYIRDAIGELYMQSNAICSRIPALVKLCTPNLRIAFAKSLVLCVRRNVVTYIEATRLFNKFNEIYFNIPVSGPFFIHNDIHKGNIIIPSSGNMPYVIDYGAFVIDKRVSLYDPVRISWDGSKDYLDANKLIFYASPMLKTSMPNDDFIRQLRIAIMCRIVGLVGRGVWNSSYSYSPHSSKFNNRVDDLVSKLWGVANGSSLMFLVS